ncbi:Gustatory receptor 61 [Hyalella azteca]|uniref:Gustatory receptor 61 n=1 Tax=Hyalella azteca TaxID=294128 RepID=A0A6A0GQB9_HYAAZ|nr:Gustatory receptor 61 [Hyalella azteca]
MKMLFERLNQKSLFLRMLQFLRLLGVLPYEKVNGKHRKSQVYLGYCVAVQILKFIFHIRKVSKLPDLRVINFFEAMYACWIIAVVILDMIISWHFLASSTVLLRMIRTLNRSRIPTIPLDKFTLSMIAATLIASFYFFFEELLLNETNNDTVYESVFGAVVFFTYMNCSLLLMSIMKIFSSNIMHTLDALSSTSIPMLEFTPSDHRKSYSTIRKQITGFQRLAKDIHECFSVVVFGILAFEQLEMGLLVLQCIYLTLTPIKNSFIFYVPVALNVWAILDSQTQYINACEEGVHRAKKLIADVGHMGPEQEVWQLRGIHAELKRMPRFTIFVFFELGRHCLLSMGSVMLTYVIIAVQFAMGSSSATCTSCICNTSNCDAK